MMMTRVRSSEEGALARRRAQLKPPQRQRRGARREHLQTPRPQRPTKVSLVYKKPNEEWHVAVITQYQRECEK